MADTDRRTNTLLRQKVDDAIRFTRQHHSVIENWPLQVYCSSLLFTPTQSETKLQHQSHIPKWIIGIHGMDIAWDSCIFTLQGHEEGVSSIAWSQDGLYVASGSTDKTVKLWDTSTGQCISSIDGYEEGVTSIAWSPDGTRLATGSSDGAIKVWDIATRECVAFSKESSAIECVTWLRDQNRLATWSVEKVFMICDPSPERPLCDPDSGFCTCPSFCAYGLNASFAWTEDMIQVAAWKRDENIEISDPVTQEKLFTLMPVNRRIRDKRSSLYLSKDGTRLAIMETDSRISIWDTRAGDLLHVLHKPGGNLKDITWSHDNGGLATVGLNEGLRIWDLTTERYSSIHTGLTGFVRSLTWSRDGAWLAGSSEYLVRIWNSSSGKCTSALEGHTKDIKSVEWSPDGTKIASGSEDTNVKIWDATRPSAPTLQKHGDEVGTISWSPDRTRLISGSDDCEVRIWDTTSGDCTLILEANNWALSVAEWSHKSAYIATTFKYSRFRHNIAKDRSPLCDGIAKRKHMSEWRHKGQQVDSDGWNCDAWVWCPDTGEFEFCIDGDGGPITAIAWSSDDSRLAASSWGSTVQVWGISNRQCIWRFKFVDFHKRMQSLSWSPDESRIATGWQGNTVKVLDLVTKQIISIFQHPDGDNDILSTTWSHDGRRLASGSTDDTVRVWDCDSGECITGLHVPSPKNLRFSRFDSNDLDTPIGTFKLNDIVSASSPNSLNVSPAQPFYGSRGNWITFGGKNVIWIPSTYRPTTWARSGLCLAIGTCLGQVLILNFQESSGRLLTKGMLDGVPDCRVLQDEVTGDWTDQRRCHQAFRLTKYEEQKDPYRQSVVEEFNEATLGSPAYISWWNNTRNDVLWILAESGCGKSGFARSITEDYIPTSNTPVTACYFFFEESDEQNNLTSALCAILHQLFAQRPHLLHHAVSTWEKNGKQIQRNVDELWEILMAAAFDEVSSNVICVLDALNECCQNDQGRLITKLKYFQCNSRSSTKGSWLKFLVTSRSCGYLQDQYQVIKETFPHLDYQDKRKEYGDLGEGGEKKSQSSNHDRSIQELLDSRNSLDDGNDQHSCTSNSACGEGHEEILRVILDPGADLDAQLAHYYNALRAACEGEHGHSVQLLLDRGANADIEGEVYDKLIRTACFNGHEKVLRCLLSHRTDILTVIDCDSEAVNRPTGNGHCTVISPPISNGADIQIVGGRGYPPIIISSCFGHLQMVELLLEGGTNVNSINNRGHTPLHYASEYGHSDLVSLLLARPDIVIDVQDDTGRTPLFLAAARGHVEILERLLRRNAFPNVKDSYQMTPLCAAIRNAHEDTIKFLLPFTEAPTDLEDGLGYKLMWWASRSGSRSVIGLVRQWVQQMAIGLWEIDLDTRYSSTGTRQSSRSCDVCTGMISHDLAYYTCKTCFNFDICLDCQSFGLLCLCSSHDWTLN